jgi:hypothetical protein
MWQYISHLGLVVGELLHMKGRIVEGMRSDGTGCGAQCIRVNISVVGQLLPYAFGFVMLSARHLVVQSPRSMIRTDRSTWHSAEL